MNTTIAEENNLKSRECEVVLVLYENPAAREQAVKFCGEFTSQSNVALQPRVRFCAFDSLNVPAKSAEALSDAVDSSLIVFAVNSAGDLPLAVKLWAESWLGKRGEREGELIGLVLDGATGPCDIACLKEVYLRHLAHRAGMDYLSHFPRMNPRALPDSLDAFSQRSGQMTSVLDEILCTHFVPPSISLN